MSFNVNRNFPDRLKGSDYNRSLSDQSMDIITHACLGYDEIDKAYKPREIDLSESGVRLFVNDQEISARRWVLDRYYQAAMSPRQFQLHRLSVVRPRQRQRRGRRVRR
jgi:hypothetical protein